MQNIMNKYNIDVIEKNGVLLTPAKNIGKLLNLSDIKSSMRGFLDDERCILKVQTNSGIQPKIHLTEKGFLKLICLSRKPISIEIAKELGLYVTYKCVPLEISFLNNIKLAFYGENMIFQYKVHSFLIDLYFSDYNLAVEYDENSHKFNTKKDTVREEYICSVINCSFIRIKEDDNIFESINKIRLFLKNKNLHKIE